MRRKPPASSITHYPPRLESVNVSMLHLPSHKQCGEQKSHFQASGKMDVWKRTTDTFIMQHDVHAIITCDVDMHIVVLSDYRHIVMLSSREMSKTLQSMSVMDQNTHLAGTHALQHG